MGDYKNIYSGVDFGLEPNYGDNFLGFDYRFPSSVFGVPTDPRTANQIKAVSDKLNTGAKVIEVTAITPEVLDYIPDQHLDELNRLRELAGVELTFHGPLVEPTGITKQGWDETDRQEAERQMFSAVDRAHKINPKGNVVVTFHSSNGLPEPETRVFNSDTGKEEITEIMVVDEREGNFNKVKPKKDYLLGKNDPYAEIARNNEEAWFRTLQHLNFNAEQGSRSLDYAFNQSLKSVSQPGEKRKGEEEILKLYKSYVNGDESKLNVFKDLSPEVKEQLQQITYGDIYIRDAYRNLQNSYNQAYEAAKRINNQEDIKKLEKFRDELAPKVKDIEDPSKIRELSGEITKAVSVLRSIKPPEIQRPLRQFAVDKSSETFANVAFKAFQEHGESAPIISIENPPAGSGLSRASDLKEVVDASRKKFVRKAIESGMSESEAKSQAEKLIGVTWDVGHINMIRKLGYNENTLIKETKTVAPYVKHIHLSDNFGLEHTELPMGMGNVPIKKHLAELQKKYGDKLKDIKQIVETGGWYQHFKITPMVETLSAFGSPVYAMKMAPYWNQARSTYGGYFAGYGQMLPEGNFSIYGAGFSGLPPELGGQMGGKNRLSGAPIE